MTRPCALRPAMRFFDDVSDFSGVFLLVISSKEADCRNRWTGV